MTEDGLCQIRGVFVIVTSSSFTPGLVFVGVGNSQDEVVHIHHHRRQDQVTIYGVSHPAPTRLHLQAAPPLRIVCVDLVPNSGVAVFTKENGDVQFSGASFFPVRLRTLDPQGQHAGGQVLDRW